MCTTWLREERGAGQDVRPRGTTGGRRLLRRSAAAAAGGDRGNRLDGALAPGRAGIRGPAAGAPPAGPAVLPGRGARGLPAAVRHHRRQDPARHAGRAHQAACRRGRAPAGQRAAAAIRRPHPVRPRLRGSRRPAPARREPAAACGPRQRRGVLRPRRPADRPAGAATRPAGSTGRTGSSWSGTSTRCSCADLERPPAGARRTGDPMPRRPVPPCPGDPGGGGNRRRSAMPPGSPEG